MAGQVHALLGYNLVVLGLPMKFCCLCSYDCAFEGLTAVKTAGLTLALVISVRQSRNKWVSV